MEAPHHKDCKCPDCELFAQMQAHFGTNKPEPNTRPLPQPSELVDLIERLESHMGKQDPQILLADCREAALELRAQSVQLAKLQADGDKLAGALERSRQGWSNVLELGLLPVQHQSTALGLQEAATQALTEWKDPKNA